MKKPLRIGVFGTNVRGRDITKNFMLLGCQVVAACDNRPAAREKMAELVKEGCTFYDNFDSFIEHPMDAVILTNFFHEHAPYAIRCLEKNLHVFSECISNGTMAEGVALVRAAEKSRGIYMLAENYPQMLFNREMQRIAAEGALGTILYVEGEYNHPGDPRNAVFAKDYNYFEEHWRNYLPRSYYITHSLGPCMRITGATPRIVTAFATQAMKIPEDAPSATRVPEKATLITTKNDDGSVFHLVGCSGFGGHHITYRVAGTRGSVENLRGMSDKVMLRFNDWELPEGRPAVSCYQPEWQDKDEEIIKASGHGGADFVTARLFVEYVEKNQQPEHPFGVHAAVAMSSVAILAHRSALEGGKPYDVPDFHNEEDRARYENDWQTPFPGRNGEPPTLPASASAPDYQPSERQLAAFRKRLE